MMIYLAADKELPLIPWNEENEQEICVTELDVDSIKVRKQFSKKYVYYVGSYQGCGCGFHYSLENKLKHKQYEHQMKGKKSVEGLFSYIRKTIKEGEKYELYACWAGNEGELRNEELDEFIDLKSFNLSNHFGFEEDQLIIINE